GEVFLTLPSWEGGHDATTSRRGGRPDAASFPRGERFPALHRALELPLHLLQAAAHRAHVLRRGLIQRRVGQPQREAVLLGFERVDALGQGFELAPLGERELARAWAIGPGRLGGRLWVGFARGRP